MSKELDTLAVVVPAYNEEHTIAGTLQALYDQRSTDTAHHIIVDNGSTDSTQGAIRRFAKDHEDFPLQVIEETQKGTGAAADTGVQLAIKHGATLIARTDADTHPSVDWTQVIADRFRQPGLQLLGGRTTALHDHDFRRGDDILMPLSVKVARFVLAAQHFNSDYLRVATGGNMATRGQAYEIVGGFPRTSIDTTDEDVAYSLRIADRFGKAAIKIDPDLLVATSMRRIREQGWTGTAIHHLRPEQRRDKEPTIDIR